MPRGTKRGKDGKETTSSGSGGSSSKKSKVNTVRKSKKSPKGNLRQTGKEGKMSGKAVRAVFNEDDSVVVYETEGLDQFPEDTEVGENNATVVHKTRNSCQSESVKGKMSSPRAERFRKMVSMASEEMGSEEIEPTRTAAWEEAEMTEMESEEEGEASMIVGLFSLYRYIRGQEKK